MSENVQLLRSDYNESDITTKSKSFIYTWKINNLRRFYEQRVSRIVSDKLDFINYCTEKPQLWEIYFNINWKGLYLPRLDQAFTIEVQFNIKAAKIDYDYFRLYIYIIDESEKDHEIYKETCTTKNSVFFVTVHICETEAKNLVDKINGLLPDSNFTLKFEIIFTKSNAVNNNIKSATSLSCINKPKFIEFENMLNNEKFSDAKIIVYDRKFHVHKVLLASQSPVFAAMFEHNMKENNENTIKITDFDHKIIQEMLRFVYTNQVMDMEVVAGDLLVAADKYDLEQLKLMCEESLINNLKVENVITLLIQAEKHGAKRLKERALEYFKLHMKEIIQTEIFKKELYNFIDLVPDMLKSLADSIN